MAHPYHHALSSMKKWGGTVEDFIGIHEFFDASKLILADFRHRALRHHAEGVYLGETVFGKTITLSTGRVIPTRWVGEQHVREDLGFIPSFADWARAIRAEPFCGCRPLCKGILTFCASDRVRSSSVVAARCARGFLPSVQVIECGLLSGLKLRHFQKPRAGMVISGSGPNLDAEL